MVELGENARSRLRSQSRLALQHGQRHLQCCEYLSDTVMEFPCDFSAFFILHLKKVNIQFSDRFFGLCALPKFNPEAAKFHKEYGEYEQTCDGQRPAHPLVGAGRNRLPLI